MRGLLRPIVAALFWLACLALPAQAAVLALGTAEAAFLAPGQPAPAPDAWRRVALPDDWADTFPGRSGEAWYRLRFDFTEPASGPGSGPALTAVYIRRACTNLEVRLNGELIGSGGRMALPVTRNCYRPQLFVLPQSLLRPQGNELQVRLVGFAAGEVSARQRAGGLSDLEVGPLAELQPHYDRQLFWNVTVAQIIAATVALLGAAMLGLAAVRRRDTYLLYFGLFSTGWALISTRLFVTEVPLSPALTEVLICSAFPPVLGCAYLFLMRFVERRIAWMDAGLALQALLVPCVLLAVVQFAPARLLTAASTVYNLTAIEFLATVAYFFRTAWRHHRREFWLMSGVLVMAVVLALVEIALQNDWLPLPKVHVIHFAMPFLFIVIGIRLVQLFVQALSHAEHANAELEQRVAEKSSEIERSYAQLTALRTAQAAQDERQRIASDLHDDLGAQLLTIAQASLRTDDRERVAGMARQALDEMRLSVRGLTAAPARAAEVLADWRAETVSRLAAAGFAADWQANEPPEALVLPARTHVQLTRILREAVSNAIRHSGGRACRVRVAVDAGGVALEVADDGRGLDARAAEGRGHGLLNIERRVRVLGGQHGFEPAPGGGTRLRLRVPLDTPGIIAP